MNINTPIPSSLDLLRDLIAFDTTSRLPNAELINYIETRLNTFGIQCTQIPNIDGTKANLYCTVGPQNTPGVMLSGHTDVVPIDGQQWTRPAFELTEADGKVYGRGTTDMKGFVACAMRAAMVASQRSLSVPLHLGFSYDEEIGCVGVRSMIDLLANAPTRPAMCIVGEPTNMQVATKHKGKYSITARCVGKEAHSSVAPNTVNAIHLATDLVKILRELQQELIDAWQGSGEERLSVPYTTVHVGNIVADQALNIVPNLCTVKFEIRNVATDNPEALLSTIKKRMEPIVTAACKHLQQVECSQSVHTSIEPSSSVSDLPSVMPAVTFTIDNTYPGLNTHPEEDVVELVKSLVGANALSSVAYGTEAGLFSQVLGIPTVVCGPGSMDQGHKPDEYITLAQLERCDVMLDRLISYLEQQADETF